MSEVLEQGGLAEAVVDGVRTFYVPTAQTPYACLSFRVGLADEKLANHGWTHLLEHLAMHELAHPAIQSNASVGLWTTDFHVSGEAEDVVDFLGSLCDWLSDPDFTALDHERAILRAEGEQRDGSSVGEHLDYRYGPSGVGLVPYPELGLERADESALSRWGERWFTAGNAALTLNAPPLPGMRLPLPTGSLQPIPPAVSVLEAPLPAHAGSRARETVASGVITDSILSTLLCDVVADEVSDELRTRQRASYGTRATVERVDADNLLLLMITDVIEERWAEGVGLVHEVLDRVAEHGVAQSRLFAMRDRTMRALADDPLKVWQAASSAHASLRGAEPLSEGLVRHRLETLDVEKVAEQVRAFRDTVLLTSPSGRQSRTDLPFTTGLPDRSVPADGRVFRSAYAPADRGRLHFTESALVFTSTGARATAGTQQGQDGSRSQQSFVELVDPAALLVFPDGARTVLSRHGAQLRIEPNRWRDGWDLTRQLDELVSRDSHVPMPARSPSDVTRPVTSTDWLRVQVSALLRATGRLVTGRQRRFFLYPLVALVLFAVTTHGSTPWRASADGFEQAVDDNMTQSFGGMPVDTDCHGVRPKVDETVACTVTWGSTHRTMTLLVRLVDKSHLRIVGGR